MRWRQRRWAGGGGGCRPATAAQDPTVAAAHAALSHAATLSVSRSSPTFALLHANKPRLLAAGWLSTATCTGGGVIVATRSELHCRRLAITLPSLSEWWPCWRTRAQQTGTAALLNYTGSSSIQYKYQCMQLISPTGTWPCRPGPACGAPRSPPPPPPGLHRPNLPAAPPPLRPRRPGTPSATRGATPQGLTGLCQGAAPTQTQSNLQRQAGGCGGWYCGRYCRLDGRLPSG